MKRSLTIRERLIKILKLRSFNLNGQPVINVAEVLNDFHLRDLDMMAQLDVNQTMRFGGGAAAEFTLRRTE